MVANLRLGGGGIDRLGQLIGLLKSLGQPDTAYCAVLLIGGPAGTGDVSPDYALQRQHPEFPAQH